MASNKRGPGAVGLSLLNFSRSRINHYVPQVNFVSRASLPASWQKASEIPLVWKDAEPEAVLPAPDAEPAEMFSASDTPEPQEAASSADLLRILELHRERQQEAPPEAPASPPPAPASPRLVQRAAQPPRASTVSDGPARRPQHTPATPSGPRVVEVVGPGPRPEAPLPVQSAAGENISLPDQPTPEPDSSVPPADQEQAAFLRTEPALPRLIQPRRKETSAGEASSSASPAPDISRAPVEMPNSGHIPQHEADVMPMDEMPPEAMIPEPPAQMIDDLVWSAPEPEAAADVQNASADVPEKPWLYAPTEQVSREAAAQATKPETTLPVLATPDGSIDSPYMPGLQRKELDTPDPALNPPPSAPIAPVLSSTDPQPLSELPPVDDDFETEQIYYLNSMERPPAPGREDRLDAIQRSLDGVQERVSSVKKNLDTLQRFTGPLNTRTTPENLPRRLQPETASYETSSTVQREPEGTGYENTLPVISEPAQSGDFNLTVPAVSEMRTFGPDIWQQPADAEPASGGKRQFAIDWSFPSNMPASQPRQEEPLRRSPAGDLSSMGVSGINANAMQEDDSGIYDDSASADLLALLNLPPDTPVRGTRSTNGSVIARSAQPSEPEPVSWASRGTDTAPHTEYQPVSLEQALDRSFSSHVPENIQREADASGEIPGSPQVQQSSSADEHAPGKANPDVDKLARDVYRVLRDRLRIEQERRTDK